ncbi:MAG: CocE/NonD family hydrolase [Gemmatimonadetes bacterium]|nr:CocE/NonD family hydrolase [Gemmatimonadota bacterium]
MRLMVAIGLAMAVMAPPRAVAQRPTWPIVVEKNVEARMRDGVILRADLYRPDARRRFPALLQRTPYSKNPGSDDRFRRLAARGYLVAVQDTRGRYLSDGVARPHDEGEDGFDTVEWLAALPWVDGQVGMFGGSYSATTQLLAAPLRPPHLVALFPSASYASRYDMVFQGGAFYLADGLSWNLGQAMDARRRALDPTADRDGEIGLSAADRRLLRTRWLLALPLVGMKELDLPRYMPGYFEMLAHPSYDDYWATFDVAARHARFEVPAYHLTGWYDALLNGTLANFTGLSRNAATDRARRSQRLIVGPWTHARPNASSTAIDGVDFGPDAGLDSFELMVGWFDHWTGPESSRDFPGPPVRIFVMGENRWRDEPAWPLERARPTDYYLSAVGPANTRNGGGLLASVPPARGTPPDTFSYDPANPVPTGTSGAYSRAPTDQRALETRPDVLVYSTEPLSTAVEVTGPVTLEVWIASSAKDTDFTGRLVDVYPDGTARALTDGILRARYRASKTAPTLLEPGRPYRLTIDLGATSNVFLPGHRIRLEVSSSNFPRYDRNPNTGAPFGQSAETRMASQTVFHDADRPSRLILPVVPR